MTGKQTTYCIILTNEFGKFISMNSKCNWHFCIHNFTRSYISQSCQLRCIFTYMMLSSEEWALMPRRIPAATWLPSFTRLNDSLTSRGHEDCTASQNDTGSDIEEIGGWMEWSLTWSSVRWWKEEHAILVRSAVTSSLHDRVSLCTRGQASWSPSWQRSGTDPSSTSSSESWLPSKRCTMERSSTQNKEMNVLLNRVFSLICFIVHNAAKNQIYVSHQAVILHKNLILIVTALMQ